MKRKTKNPAFICSVLFLIVTFIFSTYVYSYAQENFLWRVQSKKSTVYLLSSIHLLKKDIYPLNRTIENAFERSDVLVVEANINDIAKLDVAKLMEKAFYPGGDTLEKHVSGETFDFITMEMERLGMPLEFIQNQRPWFLALTLESLELLKSGFNPDYGIDKYFLSKADGKKKILELESLDYQVDLLSGFSDDDQELFLVYTLKELKTLGQEVDKLVDAWKTGATASMEATLTKSFNEDRRFYRIYEKLINERNRNMALKIEGFLKTKGSYFVVVGAAHLLGDRGIVQLLKERGYSIEQQ